PDRAQHGVPHGPLRRRHRARLRVEDLRGNSRRDPVRSARDRGLPRNRSRNLGGPLVSETDVGRGSSPATAPSLLTIDGLTCAYGPVVALEDVSISVKPGEVVCVLGVNGAGKTTMLHAIAGMVKPVRGSIVLG